ncbi:MAG: hypothetical protein ACOYK8_07925 [Alphaproteobacteria bacterium]
MPRYIINTPQDLLVVRIDGYIAREAMGKPFLRNRTDHHLEGNEISRYNQYQNAGIDREYFSITEFQQHSVNTTLLSRLEQSFPAQDAIEKAVKSMADHITHVARTAINAKMVQQLYQHHSDNLTSEITAGIALLFNNCVAHNTSFISSDDDDHTVYSAVAREITTQEMQHIFPYIANVTPWLEEIKTYPYVQLNELGLQQYYTEAVCNDNPQSWSDRLCPQLQDIARQSSPSAQAETLIAEIKNFSNQIEQDWLRPIIKLPFTDDTLTFHLSPAFILQEWEGINLPSKEGAYNIQENSIHLHQQYIEHGTNYPMAQIFAPKPLPITFSIAPSFQLRTETPRRITKKLAYLEEFFHYGVQAIFGNEALPYHQQNQKSKASYIKALIADLTLNDNSTPNQDHIKLLGLEEYIDPTTPFLQQIKNNHSNDSNFSIQVEAIAKLACITETYGLEATQQQLPHLSIYLTQHFIPAAHAYCQQHSIATPPAPTKKKNWLSFL